MSSATEHSLSGTKPLSREGGNGEYGKYPCYYTLYILGVSDGFKVSFE